MMDERLRLDYLEAMGITQYVARTPLPGALASVIMAFEDTVAAEEQPAAPVKPQRQGHIATLLEENFADSTQVGKIHTDNKPAKIEKSILQNARTLPVTHQCQIAIWTTGDLLIIADAPRMDNSQLNLLRNILIAIGIRDALPDVKQFHWPIHQCKDKSLLAAREHFQGMLDAGLLKQPGLRQILCFGKEASTLLVQGDMEAGIALDRYQDWPVINACSLHEMLAEPARKADTWRVLQVLVRH